MTTLPQLATILQNLFDDQARQLGRSCGLCRRRRKFDPMLLLKMLIFTVLKFPRPKLKNYLSIAAQLGLAITTRAVTKRFTPELIAFLRQALRHLLQTAVAAVRVDAPLLAKFTAVFVGDSTTITLPEPYASEFPGCGGKSGSGRAALKLQVVWELCAGTLTWLGIEPGRRSDAKSPAVEATPPAGSLSIWDLGYFSLKRFQAWTTAGAYWISRFQPGTVVVDAAGKPWNLGPWLREHLGHGGFVDVAIRLGSEQRVACRLIAFAAPPEVAARRRQKAYEKAQKSGRTPTAEHLEWCDWTVFVTNCPESLLSRQEVVVLYRTRWQIELLFKVWKSNNGLAWRGSTQCPVRAMVEFWSKLIGVLVQHWLLVTMTWGEHRRSLMRAAEELREWLTVLIEALNDHERLTARLTQLQSVLLATARVDRRKKKPSWFQLLEDPRLLDYTC
jgi:hypothetical protein